MSQECKPRAGRGPLNSDPHPTLGRSPRALKKPDTHSKRLLPTASALLPFILTWNSPKWTSRAPSMSHMSCKAPQGGSAPARGWAGWGERSGLEGAEGREEGTHKPCQSEAGGQSFLRAQGTP